MVFLICLLSAGLLAFSFPQIQWSFLAWFALVPFFHLIDGKKSWRAFRRGYLCGFLFFFVTVGWFVYVTYVGAFVAVAYLALYFAVYGVIFVYFQRFSLMARIFVLSASWVALEFIRAHLVTGFDWAMLGHSQYKNLWLIQIADITGGYGVSFLVILVNLLIFETLRVRAFLFKANILVIVILSSVLIYGWWVTGQKKDYEMVRVGVVQPNIPLALDWDDSKKPWIVAHTIQLTRKLKDQNLDLIVWPETSLPGMIIDAPSLTNEIQATAADLHTPMLIGSIANKDEAYYNSAFFIDADGHMMGRYDKIHLVPFGEFLPFRPILGWINKFVPFDDFTPGNTYKIFSIPSASSHAEDSVRSQKKFGVLICFEDTVGHLRRHFVQEGADFLVNMTNDAWFRDTKAPFLHLQSAVLGCVENHRSLARAANTGVSALIDPWGRIITTVVDEHGKETFIEGSAWGVLPLVHEKTFYTKYGDVFTYMCFLCILVAGVLRRFI